MADAHHAFAAVGEGAILQRRACKLGFLCRSESGGLKRISLAQEQERTPGYAIGDPSVTGSRPPSPSLGATQCHGHTFPRFSVESPTESRMHRYFPDPPQNDKSILRKCVQMHPFLSSCKAPQAAKPHAQICPRHSTGFPHPYGLRRVRLRGCPGEGCAQGPVPVVQAAQAEARGGRARRQENHGHGWHGRGNPHREGGEGRGAPLFCFFRFPHGSWRVALRL